MDRHQGDGVGGPVIAVHIGDERHLFEEAGQAALLAHLVVERGLGEELLDVLTPLLVVGLPQPLAAAALLDHPLAELGHRAIHGAPEALDQVAEGHDGVARPAAERVDLLDAGHGLPEGRLVLGGPGPHAGDARLADAAGRAVDDAHEAQIVTGVDADPQVGDEILDLLTVVEGHGPDDTVRHGGLDEGLLEAARLGVRAIEDRDVAPLPARLPRAADLRERDRRLAICVRPQAEADGRPLLVLRPDAALVAHGVPLDDARGAAADGLGRAEVLLELHHTRVGVVLREAQDVLDVGPAPSVDGLVGVACGADVAAQLGQEAGDEVLGVVGVLVLVDEDEVEARLPAVAEPGLVAQADGDAHEQVVEVERAVRAEQLVVGFVDLDDDLVAEALGVACQLARVPELGLGAADTVEGGGGGHGAADVRLLEGHLDGLELVVAIVDAEVGVEAERVGGDAQHLRAQRVEGGDPGAAGAGELLDALAHLARRLVREGDRQDAVRGDALSAQVGHTPGDDAGLAAAGACHDQQGAFDVGCRLALHFCQVGEYRVNVCHWKPPSGGSSGGVKAQLPGPL